VLAEGETGFIVPIRDVSAIVQRIEWALANRDGLFEMGQAAARSARALSWARFRQGLVNAYLNISEPRSSLEPSRAEVLL